MAFVTHFACAVLGACLGFAVAAILAAGRG